MPPSDRSVTRDLTLLDLHEAFGEPGLLSVRVEIKESATASWTPEKGTPRSVVRKSFKLAVESLLAEHLDAKGRAA